MCPKRPIWADLGICSSWVCPEKDDFDLNPWRSSVRIHQGISANPSRVSVRIHGSLVWIHQGHQCICTNRFRVRIHQGHQSNPPGSSVRIHRVIGANPRVIRHCTSRFRRESMFCFRADHKCTFTKGDFGPNPCFVFVLIPGEHIACGPNPCFVFVAITVVDEHISQKLKSAQIHLWLYVVFISAYLQKWISAQINLWLYVLFISAYLQKWISAQIHLYLSIKMHFVALGHRIWS